jgi:GMP synthase PP-ATPase subunit
LGKADLYDKTSQAFAVFLPVKSVGVVGDAHQDAARDPGGACRLQTKTPREVRGVLKSTRYSDFHFSLTLAWICSKASITILTPFGETPIAPLPIIATMMSRVISVAVS